MPPPLPRCSSWVYSSLISPSCVSLPRKGRRVGLHIDLFEACSAFTHVAACTLARSPIRDPLIEGFSHFVTSMTAPIASGWSESPGGTCTHWKAPPCHGAHPLQSLACVGRSSAKSGPYGGSAAVPNARIKRIRKRTMPGREGRQLDESEKRRSGIINYSSALNCHKIHGNRAQ
jgi:hypothetical protein